jgi:ribonuclease M5
MRRVRQAIVVEGKHDVIRVHSAVDAVVVPTDGFRIFKDQEKMAMLRRLAQVRGLIVLTDSDSAGGVIRNHLLSCIPAEQLKQAYIPPVAGKERRKSAPSKEGLLGVEGMDAATVIAALERAGAVFEDEENPAHISLNLTKADWMALGLSGTADSAARRLRLAEALGVPTYLSANRLLELVNTTVTASEWVELLKFIDTD